ncbi:glycosyltransferase [Neorhodopirellula pilleata]|uniref:Glycosyl transferase family 8 n=1 Tax=Neorhodopirellula pilleata TaxID=2714738 RepID=A0A5C5ZGU8_9BACT|nr:glycosyltransferase [Neorhodopirellula pilleata]TWT86091.1 Glycosyl transferase family 8 [Neorhodopirellula pilleata]
MIELTQWWDTVKDELNGEWLILGKGPTLGDYRPETDTRPVIALNHVILQYQATVAHAIDLDVVADCEEAIEKNARFLLMPLVPNVNCLACGQTLDQFFDVLPVLRKLDAEQRLVWYWLQNGLSENLKPNLNTPSIRPKYFSVEAVINILGELKIKSVRSYGIDGGSSYASQFKKLEKKTLLKNGRTSFDAQFDEILLLTKKYSMDYKPMTDPMRIFVGTDDSQIVAAKVLEHSIKKYASRPVQVVHMLNLPYPKISNPNVKPGTNFSFARFLIPELAGFRGRAMYVDADMQVFADVAELWGIPFNDQTVLCTRQDYIPEVWQVKNCPFTPGRQMSVMLLDCDRLDWQIVPIIEQLNRGDFTYKELLTQLSIISPDQIRDDLDPGWNCLEYFDKDRTKLLHYTSVPTQPWKNKSNPLAEIWMEGFREACRDGAVTLEDVGRAVVEGHVRIELLEEARKIYAELNVNTHAEISPIDAAREELWNAVHRLARVEQELAGIKRSLPYRAYSLLRRNITRFGLSRSVER